MGDTNEARQQWTKVTELKPIYAQDKRYQAMAFKAEAAGSALRTTIPNSSRKEA